MDFDIKNIYALKMFYEKTSKYLDYSETPRKNNLLHFIVSGEREYTVNKRTFTVKPNTLIFIPHNTCYKTRALQDGVGIGICFDGDIFSDEKDLDVYTKNDILQNEKIKKLFEKVSDIHNTIPRNFLKIKLTTIKILSVLAETEKPKEYALIEDAVTFINENYEKNLPVKTYANKCNLSESYFRKKFSELLGKSPIEYRNELRFAKAKHLYQNNHNTEEIAETLGFCDARYMLKLYRQQTGKSLKKDAEII